MRADERIAQAILRTAEEQFRRVSEEAQPQVQHAQAAAKSAEERAAPGISRLMSAEEGIAMGDQDQYGVLHGSGSSGGSQGMPTGNHGATTSTSTSSSGAAPTIAPGEKGSVRRRTKDGLPDDDQQAHTYVRADSCSCRHCKLPLNSRNDLFKHFRESNYHGNIWSDMDSSSPEYEGEDG